MAYILVIEDENFIRENIVEILNLEGFEVRAVDSGLDGLKVAHQYPPDLILCDIMMPGMDGWDVLLHLRSDPETTNIPFIFITALAERTNMRRGMSLGADDYIIKPFTPADLVAAINARLWKQAQLVEQYEARMDQLRGNIIRSLPHELRTPLTGIMGCAEFLAMDHENITPDRILNLANIIERSAKRLQDLIENYLIYAQLELIATDRERIAAMRAAEADSAAIRDVGLVRAEQNNRLNDLQINVTPAWAAISDQDLWKIVGEIIDNAFKFSPSGTPVTLTAYPADRRYHIIITDQGRGMSVDDLHNIGAYSQFERSLYEQQGMGLGLVISRRLAELHNGGLTIESTPGRGTMVTVTLPLR